MLQPAEQRGFDAYQKHIALRLHFETPSYNYFICNGKLKLGTDAQTRFLHHKNKYKYYKLAKKYPNNLRDFIVANLVADNGKRIDDLFGLEAENHYIRWQRVTESLTYTFDNDLCVLMDANKDWALAKNDQYPPVVTMVMQGDIQLETFVLLERTMNLLDLWGELFYKDDVIFEKFTSKVKKYSPFVHYDKEKIDEVIDGVMNDYAND